nr:CHAT domain-containing protein [Micromonospora sp. DSM 115978]
MARLAGLVAQLAEAESAFDAVAIRVATLALRALLPHLPARDPRQGGRDVPADAAVRVCLAGLLHFRITMDIGALRESLAVQRALLESSALDAQTQVALLIVTCGNLEELYGYTGVPAVLDEAVTAGRAGLRLAYDSGTSRRLILATVASALSTRYQATGDTAALDEATVTYRQAVDDGTADGSSDAADAGTRALCLDGLSFCLGSRFLAGGDTADLDQAVSASRRAVALTSAEDRARAGYLHNLGNTLILTSKQGAHDQIPVLDEVVAIHQEAVDHTGPDDAALPRRLIRLSNALHERYGARADDPDHLVRAHQVARAAVSAARDARSAVRHDALWHLRLVLATMRSRDEHALELADARLRALTPGGGDGTAAPDLAAGMDAMTRFEAAAALRRREDAARSLHEHQLGRSELGELIRLGRELAGSAPADSRVRAVYLCAIGSTFRERLRRYGDPADRHAAAEAFADAAEVPAADASVRADAAVQCAELAAEDQDWPRAAAAYRKLVELLPDVVAPNLRHEDQAERVFGYRTAGSDAAACALRAGGDPVDAAGLLEQGRGIVLTRMLESRSVAANRHLRPFDPARLSDLADHGPIVAVDASRYGSYALIISGAGVQALPLPDLDRREVLHRAEALTAAVQLAAGRHDPEHALAASRSLDGTLGWLWDTVAEPVLTAIGPDTATGTAEPGTRIWWMPIGRIGALPLHAAGHHSDVGGRSLLNRAVSSYAPTLRSLWHSRAVWTRHTTVRRAAAVAIRHTPGRAELAHAQPEATLVNSLFPDARLLVGSHATAAEVSAALNDSEWAHFACHAESGTDSIWTSRLLLHDQALSVADLARIRNPGGYLAYLSACDTARTGPDPADETIHISSAFQLAGYAHVIATRWPVHDDVAYQVATDVYQDLGRDPSKLDPARALHRAVRRLRDRYPLSPLLWASYVHAGP